MEDLCDNALLEEYVARHSEPAFDILVRRYMKLVHSTALRHVGNAEDAKEITQAVFILLARKAAGFNERIILSGWLYQTTRLTAITFLRAEQRRRRREEQATMDSMHDNQSDEATLLALGSHLDNAMAKLNEKERTALVLRFLEGKTFNQIASALGQNQSAIQKRVDRSLEKLRHFIMQEGVTISSSALVGAMQTSHSTAAGASISVSNLISTALNGAPGGSLADLLSEQTAKEFVRLKMKSVATAVFCCLSIVGATAFLLNWAGLLQRTKMGNSDGIFEVRSAGLYHGAPWVFIASNSVTAQIRVLETNKTDAGLLVPLVWLVGQAYDISPARMNLPAPWRKNDCSYFQAGFSEDQRAKLRRLIQDTYRLKGKRQSRATDIWSMTVKTPAPGLHLTSGGEGSVSLFTERGNFSGTNVEISVLQGILENYLVRPVIDQTDLTNRYDFKVMWNQQPGEPGATALVDAVREQLGIELSPDRRSIDTLIVEQVQQ